MNGSTSQTLALSISIFVLFVATGCMSSKTKADVLGVKIGDRLQSHEEVVSYRCEEATSISTLWFGGKNKNVCLTLNRTALRYSYTDVHPLTSNAVMEVIQIKYWNGVDAEGYMIKVRDVSDGKEYWVSDLGAENVFGLRRAR